MTVIVEFPTPAFPPTAVPTPRSKPIFESDMQEARTFYLVLKVAVAAGDSGLLAERTQYPLPVIVKGVSTTINSPADLEKAYDRILDSAARDAIYSFDEQDLVLMPGGIRAADGLLWFNLFCLDAACSQSEFRITAINN